MSDKEDNTGGQPGPDLATLEKKLTCLYDSLKHKEVAISTASFGMPGLLPGTGGPAGYALLFKKLEEARQAINMKEAARAERLIYEAWAHFHWCEKNVHWITRPPERVQGEAQAGSWSNWLVQLLPAPLRRLPRWVFLLLYMAAWIAGVAGVATARGNWELASVPVPYLFWGTLGGAAAGIFGVWIHTARADFDRNFVPWYLAKPLIGGVAGAIVFVLGDNISPWEEAVATAPSEFATTATGKALFVAAFVMGFFESLFISVLEIVRAKMRDVVAAALGQPEQKPQG